MCILLHNFGSRRLKMAVGLKFLETLRGVTEDNYEKKLSAILDPDPDEVKAGKQYKRVMGYDPITYHTDYKISAVLTAIEKEIPDLASTLKDLEANIKDAIHSEIREMKKEVIATIIFDALITSSTEVNLDVIELKRIIEDTLDISEVIETPEMEEDPDVEVYDMLMEDDEDDDSIFDIDDEDLDDEDE